MKTTFKITKNIRNIPLIQLHNYCIIHNAELDVENEEIIIMEAKKR